VIIFSYEPGIEQFHEMYVERSETSTSTATQIRSSAQRGGYSYILEILEDHSLDTRPWNNGNCSRTGVFIVGLIAASLFFFNLKIRTAVRPTIVTNRGVNGEHHGRVRHLPTRGTEREGIGDHFSYGGASSCKLLSYV
jgi:hypothetical protein